MKIQMSILTVVIYCMWVKLSEASLAKIMTREHYDQMVYNQDDRIIGHPLTLQKCYEYERNSRNVHSCKLAMNNFPVLTHLSEEFLSKKLNHWDDGSSSDHLQQADSNYFGYTVQGRKKRSALVEHNEAKSRARREIPGNPCVSRYSVKTTVLYAIDCNTGEVVEMLQDPGNLLFQTFFTYSCNAYKFFYFTCKPQYMSFMTAVYTGYDDEVEIRCVQIPTHCSISIERRT